MDGKLTLTKDHVVTHNGKEYTLLPGSVLLVKDWNPPKDVPSSQSEPGGSGSWGMEGIMGRRP